MRLINLFFGLHSNVYLTVLLGFVFFILAIDPFNVDDIKFIVLSFVCLIFCLFSLLFNSYNFIKLDKIDVFFVLFLLTSLSGLFIAIDTSLIWNEFAIYILFFTCMIIVKSFLGKDHNTYKKIFYNIISIGAVFYAFYSFCFLFIFDYFFELGNGFTRYVFDTLKIQYSNFFDIRMTWWKFFGNNPNVVSFNLLGFLPFILFVKKNAFPFKLLKTTYTLLVFIIIMLASSQGVMLCFLLLLAFYFYVEYPNSKLWRVTFFLVTILILFLLFSSIFYKGLLDYTFLFKQFDRPGALGNRVHGFINSIRGFKEKPLFGYGLGNWHLIACKFNNLDLLNTFKAVDPIYKSSLHSHNLVGKILLEQGVIGLFTFLAPIFIVFKIFFSTKTTKSRLTNMCICVLGIYLFCSIFYRAIISFEGYFCLLQLLFFLSLGILSKSVDNIERQSKIITSVFLILTTFSTVWFTYQYYSSKTIQNQIKLIDKSPVESLNRLTAIYNPCFRSTYKDGRPLSLVIANLNYELGRIDDAGIYYQKALEKAPYNTSVLSSYSNYLLKEKLDFSKASKYCDLALRIGSPLYKKIKLQQIDLSILKEDFSQVRTLLNKRFIGKYQSEKALVLLREKQLYFCGHSNYLNELINLSVEQYTALNSFKEKYGLLDNGINTIIKRIGVYSMNYQESKTILQNYNLLEKELFKILNEIQFKVYLRDHRYCRYKYEIENNQIYDIKLSEKQKTELLDLKLSIGIDIEYLNFEIRANNSSLNLKLLSALKNEMTLKKEMFSSKFDQIISYN